MIALQKQEQKMDKISAIIVTKNEEKMIKDCLESIKWVDEIIIVDDISTDRTVEICRRYPNVKVYKRKMEGFGPQKNYALGKTTGEWILSIDADERVTPELKKEMLRKISQETYDGYYLQLKSLVFGKWILDYKPRNLRLFKKEKGKFTSKKVHEAVILNGKIGVLENLLLHLSSSYGNMADYISIQVNQYSSYTADDLYNMGRRITRKNWFFNFVLRPTVIFFQKYFLKKGYREGLDGFSLSILAAFTYFVSYAKLLEKQNKIKRSQDNGEQADPGKGIGGLYSAFF